MLRRAQIINFFILLFFSGVNAQFSFKSIEGCAVLGAGMTLEDAKAKAIEQLKLAAFQKAGISEELTTNSYLMQKKSTTENVDTYYESTMSEQKGEITFFEEQNTSQSIGENNEIIICVSAKIEVAKFSNDIGEKATISVKGLEKNYKNNSSLRFSLRGNKPNFYWVYLIDAMDNYILLYPREISNEHRLPIKKTVLLPDVSKEEWILNTDSTEEKNSLLIVSADLDGQTPKSVSKFNEWSQWYKTLPFKSRKKQIFNFVIFN